MKKHLAKLLQRPGIHRTRSSRLKQLRLESLEGRRLLAADLVDVPFPYQNDLIAEDVSGDYNVSALDALLVINAINANQSGELPEVEPGRKADGPLVDTSGDNFLSAIDAFKVINFLNGEGETTPTAVYSYQFVDSSGNPLSSNTVAVGDIFQLQTFIRDTRGFSARGINAAYLDIAFDNDASFDVAVGEIQTVKFFLDQLDLTNTGSSFTLSLDGQTTAPIALFTAGGNPRSDSAIATSMQDALAALSNVGEGNVTAIVDQIATSEDAENGVPRYNFEVRFGNALAGQNLPLLTLDDSNVGVVTDGMFDFSIAEVLAGDQSTPAAEAQAFVFADLYDFSRRSEVTENEFNDVGAASQQIPLPSPAENKLLFTVPLIARAPGVINFTPNEADNPPATDMVTGVTVIPTMMVDYGSAFSITVISDPTAPMAVNDSLSTAEDTPLTVNGNVTSNDTVTSPRTLSVQSVAALPSTVGTLSGLTYTPPQDFVGTDTFTYIAVDSTGLQSNVATVTVTVTAVNDAPTANNDSFSVDEDSTGNTLDVLANDSAGPGETTDTLTVTQVGSTSNGGTVAIGPGGASVTYTPPAGVIGTDTFTYTVTDGGGLTATATVTVDIEATVLPRGRTDTATTAENTPVTINVLSNDRVNLDSQATLVSVSDGSFGTVVINDNGTPADLTDDSVTYTPTDANFFGTDTFTYVMNDTSGLGVDSTGTVTVTVTNVNDAPELADDTATATEDTAATIAISTLLSNDSPGAGEGSGSQAPQTLTLTSVASASAGGAVAIVGTNVVYTPSADFNGTYLFTYTASDNGSPVLSSTATVTVTVNAVNDNPIAGGDSASTNEDNAVNISAATLLANDLPGPATATDEANQTLTVTGVSATSANGGTVSLSGTTVSYVPAANFNGSDTFTYTLSDGAGGTATGTVAVNVAAINDAPIAGTDTATAFTEIPLILQASELLANDSAGPANESAQTLSIVAVSATASTNGTVVLNGDGTVTYTPAAGFTGPASFEYTLQDSGPTGGANVNQATGTVNVTVESFVPTTISGTVFVDETGDGIVNEAERRLGAIEVVISGTSLGQSIEPQSVLTLSDGSYSFDNLGPGEYIISYVLPGFFIDGMDVPGALGDSDSVENQFTVRVAEPGGGDGSGYNFAVRGISGQYARIMDQLVSSYVIMNPSLAYNGAYFGIGSDNSLLWSAKLDGFDDAVFAEAVFDSTGTEILMTYVDSEQRVFTASLGRGEFIKIHDASGNSLIRVLGEASDFDWQQVNLATPPFNASKYLDSVDEVFAQEGW